MEIINSMEFKTKCLASAIGLLSIFLFHNFFIALSEIDGVHRPMKQHEKIDKRNYQAMNEERRNKRPSTSFMLASYYSDHMVLQKEPYSSIIWGFCNKGGSVAAQLDHTVVSYSGQIEDEPIGTTAIWSISLPPQPPGGPHTITLTYTSNDNVTEALVLLNVLFGDVWFCSGQSNMYFPLKQMTNSSRLVDEAWKYKKIRYFQTMLQRSITPNTNLKVVNDKWSQVDKGDAAITEFSALCWLFGKQLYDKLQYPVGLVHSSYPGTTIEEWSIYDSLQKCNASNMDDKKEGVFNTLLSRLTGSSRSSLWNAMVHPFLRMVLKGVIWYQGEYNTGFHLNQYACTFPSLISSWRNEWNKATQGISDAEFPFGFVQLAGYKGRDTAGWPWLRWHQTADYSFVPNERMKNTFMAAAVDVPDETSPKNIHPKDKLTIADRLSWAALNQVYGQISFPKRGPTVKETSLKYERAGFLLLSYDQPVLIKNHTNFKYCCVKPPEMCSLDTNTKDWFSVNEIHQDNNNTVRLEVSCEPTELLYAWDALPCLYKQCAIYSNDKYHLPASPWRWKIY